VLFSLLNRFVHVQLVNYIVALENMRSGMPADLHRYGWPHTSLHHISDGGSKQVVEEKPWRPWNDGSLNPRRSEDERVTS